LAVRTTGGEIERQPVDKINKRYDDYHLQLPKSNEKINDEAYHTKGKNVLKLRVMHEAQTRKDGKMMIQSTQNLHNRSERTEY
jgi:hypothetical protein